MEFGLFIQHNLWILPLLAVWIYPWKAVALWRAARNGHYVWFAILLILNTLAILEIVYIVFFSKPQEKKIVAKKTSRSSRKKA